MHSSTSSFDRPIPARSFGWMIVCVVLLTVLTIGIWEMRARANGYQPTITDDEDLWASQRRAVQPDSIVIIGDSRPWFDLDLDELEKALGKRPIQLALAGSSVWPILEEISKDKKFHGTVIVGSVPAMMFAPGGPPIFDPMKRLARYRHATIAQRLGHQIGLYLEEQFAFLNPDLTFEMFLASFHIADRAGYHPPPELPPYFCTVDRDRRARMIERCVVPGPFQDHVRQVWMGLFTPPPAPPPVPGMPPFDMAKAIETRFNGIETAVNELKARGCKIVFLRLPYSGELRALEDKLTPRAMLWDGFLLRLKSPGIHFDDYPELACFTCPEWSHLSAPDSVLFTQRLVPHLLEALKQ